MGSRSKTSPERSAAAASIAGASLVGLALLTGCGSSHAGAPDPGEGGDAGPDAAVHTDAGVEIDRIAGDGEHLFWVQRTAPVEDPSTYPRVELWTAPYTTEGAALRPRLLVELPGSSWVADLRYGAGHVAVAENSELVSVTSLRSGRIGSVDPPRDTAWSTSSVIYLGPEEIALAPRWQRAYRAESSTLQIIRYDSLPFD